MHDDVIAALERAIWRAMLLPFGHRDAPTIKADVTALRAHADELRRGEWRDIASVPNSPEVVLFFRPGTKKAFMARADDYHQDAFWAQEVTQWQPLPAPPTKGNDDAE